MDKYIYKLIKEQFNVNDLDFSNESDYDSNIFNKNIPNPVKVYKNIIKQKHVYDYEIDYMNYIEPAAVKVRNRPELDLVISYYAEHGFNNASLNWLDISCITDMQFLFNEMEFNGDISMWNVSNVTNMFGTFMNSKFNSDISKWDVSRVTNMSQMFCFSEFNGDISMWDVSSVVNMQTMFSDSVFNGDISDWDVSSVNNMAYMFKNSEFNSDISKWDVSHVFVMAEMFYNSKFNQDISNWNVVALIHTDIFKKCLIKKKYKPINIR